MKKIAYYIGMAGFCAFLALVVTGLLGSIYAVGVLASYYAGEAFAVFCYSLFLLFLIMLLVD